MQKWEYCAVIGVGREGIVFGGADPALYTFNQDGTQEQRIGGKIYREIGKIVAKLGAEGWEMVGIGATHGGNYHTIYFKRPLPQSSS